MFPTRVRPQSGKGISQCITSDCLSRLENHEQTGFDEEVVRDVAGVMFSGKFVPKILAPVPMFLIVGRSCS